MRTPQGHQVAYNAQIAVDAKHKLIVAFDLTTKGNDQQQLHAMAVQGKAAVAADTNPVVAIAAIRAANRGALRAGWDHGHRCPRGRTVNPKGKQYFSRDQFSYDRERTAGVARRRTLSLTDLAHAEEEGVHEQGLPTCPPPAACTKGGAAGDPCAIFTRMTARPCTSALGPTDLDEASSRNG